MIIVSMKRRGRINDFLHYSSISSFVISVYYIFYAPRDWIDNHTLHSRYFPVLEFTLHTFSTLGACSFGGRTLAKYTECLKKS